MSGTDQGVTKPKVDKKPQWVVEPGWLETVVGQKLNMGRKQSVAECKLSVNSLCNFCWYCNLQPSKQIF